MVKYPRNRQALRQGGTCLPEVSIEGASIIVRYSIIMQALGGRAAPKAQDGLMRRSAGSRDEEEEPQNTLITNRHSFDRKMG
jgi:hypothetical protein